MSWKGDPPFNRTITECELTEKFFSEHEKLSSIPNLFLSRFGNFIHPSLVEKIIPSLFFNGFVDLLKHRGSRNVDTERIVRYPVKKVMRHSKESLADIYVKDYLFRDIITTNYVNFNKKIPRDKLLKRVFNACDFKISDRLFSDILELGNPNLLADIASECLPSQVMKELKKKAVVIDKKSLTNELDKIVYVRGSGSCSPHNVDELCKCDNGVTEITVDNLKHIPACLKKFKRLEEFNVRYGDVRKLENLDGLDMLRTLKMVSSNVRKIDGIGSLRRLEHLDLSHNKIGKIEGIESLKNLRNLKLHGNNIKRIENVSNLKLLSQLDLDENKIEKIENLDGLDYLSSITLSRNRIKEIEGLENLQFLQDLNLHDNLITDISTMGSVSSLEHLNVSRNKLKTVNGVKSLSKSLVSIDLNNNELTSIGEMGNRFERLTSVLMNKNKITNLTGLEELVKSPKLTEIDLVGNKIEDFPSINLTRLKIIIRGNPNIKRSSDVRFGRSYAYNWW